MGCSRKSFRKKKSAKRWAKKHGGALRGRPGKWKVCYGRRKK